MPHLAASFHGFHHTVDSALEVLSALGISSSRVTLSMDGRGYPTRWVVAQSPAPGAPLEAGHSIQLRIAGMGYFHHLPVPFWDSGGESEMGTREMLSVVDDPYQKAAHWLREGARLFDISERNPDACARWITLFGLDPEHWPQDLWFRLALLLPSLQSLAGKEDGIRFALHLILGLPLETIRRKARSRFLAEGDLSLLGEEHSRLGVDFVAGDHIEDLAALTLDIGPVPLETYYRFQEEENLYLLNAVLYLTTSCHQRWNVQWSIEDRARPPRLGIAAANSRLGLNTHLGPQKGALSA
ncbi:MAG: type VI secretion system baseplate subunit TssG [Acidobacteria bacterium]|nr:type VI secretion system baseplate subunit TssG [Acidobacteriota bacterium]